MFPALSRGKSIAVHFVLCRPAFGRPASALPFASLTALLSQSLSPFGRLGGRGFNLVACLCVARRQAALPRQEISGSIDCPGMDWVLMKIT